MAVPPYKVMKPLLRFCRSVVENSAPVFVESRPADGAEKDECFKNVRLHVDKEGGEVVHGWAIWEWPKIYYEAEFHCLWRSNDGELVDITPNSPPYPWILFLPDPKKVYRGRLVNNHRKPLTRDDVLVRFYAVCERWHQVKCLQYEPGFVETQEWFSLMMKLSEQRLQCDQKMLARFGERLKPAIFHRLTCPMPKT